MEQGLKDGLAGFRRLVESMVGTLTEEEWQALVPVARWQRFAPGDIVVNIGDTSHHFAYVIDGLFRAYFVTDSGREYTRHFWVAGSMCGAYTAYLGRKPSHICVQAVEAGNGLIIPLAHVEHLTTRYQRWLLWARRVAEYYVLDWEKRSQDLIALDAKQRFEEFRKQYPGLETRVKQQAIASYLGITPESLSRLMRNRK